MKQLDTNVIYLHVNYSEQFVLSNGISFGEFVASLPTDIHQVLLLKHQFEDTEVHMHTLLDYVKKDPFYQLAQEDVASYGDFCWVDFEEIEGADVLDGQEIAELLYLGHMKKHLRLPFFQKLNNRYVYLSHDDRYWTKVYYRYFEDFYHILGAVIGRRLSGTKLERSFLRLKKKHYPPIPKEFLYPFMDYLKEGMVISFDHVQFSRTKIELPVWIAGDFLNMDEMLEHFQKIAKREVDGKIVFDRKTREWRSYIN
jgi:hypothetical protein